MESVSLHLGQQSHSFQPCEEGMQSFALSEDSIYQREGQVRYIQFPDKLSSISVISFLIAWTFQTERQLLISTMLQ